MLLAGKNAPEHGHRQDTLFQGIGLPQQSIQDVILPPFHGHPISQADRLSSKSLGDRSFKVECRLTAL